MDNNTQESIDDQKFILQIAKIVQKGNPTKSSAMIHQIFDGIFADPPERIECSDGCNYCCYSRVMVTETEMKEIAFYMRKTFNKSQMDAARDKARAIKKKHQKLTKVERIESRDLCPLNVAGSCSVYGARPTYCRAAMSFSKSACQVAHEEDTSIPVPMVKATKRKADDIYVGIVIGEGKKEYELTIAEGLLKEFRW